MQQQTGKQVGVRVFARFRPCDIHKSISNGPNNKFEIINGKSVSLQSSLSTTDHLFHLDMVFKQNTDQQELFKYVGEPIMKDVLYGYNGTIFAFGQTGSGKTHSLFGDMNDPSSNNRGIIPRSCEMLFNHIENAQDIEEVTIKCSFIEIYQEKLQDLLAPNNKLKIRQNSDKSVYVQNVHEEYVSCFNDVYDILQIGFRNRAVASTLMNQQSSRSHGILILTIKQTSRSGTVKISKVNFADLAGSERIRKTGATGQALDEAKSINLSLSALGNVISALTTNRKKKHIPYRDSKLTYLLQDALGGNTKTSLVVTCSSEKYNLEETISTLRFATRAKQIKNKCTVNKQLSVKELQIICEVYKKQLGIANATIIRLQKLLQLLRSPKYNDEKYGKQIDTYLNQLKKKNDGTARNSAISPINNSSTQQPNNQTIIISKVASPKAKLSSSFKPKLAAVNLKQSISVQTTPTNEEQKMNSNEKSDDTNSTNNSSFASSSPSPAPAPEDDAIVIINNLNTTIDSKDKEIEQLNEEMRQLKAKIYSKDQQIESIKDENVVLSLKLTDIQVSKQQENDDEQNEENKDEDENKEQIKIEMELQSVIDNQLKMIDQIKSENQEITNDRQQLLLWNQELQKKLNDLEDNEDTNQLSENIETIKSNLLINEENISEIFENQLKSLKTITSRSYSLVPTSQTEQKENANHPSRRNNLRRNSIEEHKLKAQQTSLIILNLQKKLAKVPELSKEASRDLVNAAITSIRCLLDSSISTELEFKDVNLKAINEHNDLSSNEIAEIELLKHENQKLIRKLAEMKKTWIAHLDMLMGPNTLDNEYQKFNPNDISMNNVTPITSKSRKSKFNFGRKSSKIIKPIRSKNKRNNSSKLFGIRNVVNYLSGALINNFAHDSILRGSLLMCNKKISLVNFRIDPKRDWKKLYIVLTKHELLAYRSLRDAEHNHKHPLFQLELKKMISVLRIEQVLSAMALTSSPRTSKEILFDKANNGVFILTTLDDKYVFKARKDISRDVWIDNFEKLLCDSDSF